MKSSPLVLIPEDSHRNGGFGTGFFFKHGQSHYLVTARHNVKHHATVYFSSQKGGFGDKVWMGHDCKTVYIFSPKQLPLDIESPPSPLEKVDLKSVSVYESSTWDVAVIELVTFSPERHGFSEWDTIVTPNGGDEVSFTGSDVLDNSTIGGMRTETGIVENDPEYFQMGSNQLFIKGVRDKIKGGFSGSPVYSNGLTGVLTSHNTTIGKERAEKEVYYGNFFPSSTILDLLPETND